MVDRITIKAIVDENGESLNRFKIFINDTEIKNATEFGTDVKRDGGVVKQEFYIKLLADVTIERTTE